LPRRSSESLKRRFRDAGAESGMRAHQRKRQRTRRLTIIITVLIIAVSIAVGVYIATTANAGSPIDKYIGKPVSPTDMAALQAVSEQPYGPAAPTAMQTDVNNYGGSPFISHGKPVVLYVGADYCPYCAVERWSLIMALERFGNFSSLHYMTSAAGDIPPGDYATFTFVNSSYTSSYIAFRGYEMYDRSDAPLQAVPANYSSVFSSFGSGFPFLDFGNTYVIKASLLAYPQNIAGKNWTAVLSEIGTSDSVGLEFREAANLITGVICKLTQGNPQSVCTAPGVATSTQTIAGPAQAALTVGLASVPQYGASVAPPRRLR